MNALFGRARGPYGSNSRRRSASGYTLIEVMVVMALLTLLMAAAAGSISAGKFISQRLSDYTAALAVVDAQMETIRTTTYNPPNATFGASTVVTTQASSIMLNQSGTTFIVPGTVTTTTTPIAAGHLVTVSGTFQTRRKPITVSLQTVVNKFSPEQP